MTDLTRDFSPENSDIMDILTLGLGLERVLGLELGRQDVPGLKNTGVNFLASGRSRQDVADPKKSYRSSSSLHPHTVAHLCNQFNHVFAMLISMPRFKSSNLNQTRPKIKLLLQKNYKIAKQNL